MIRDNALRLARILLAVTVGVIVAVVLNVALSAALRFLGIPTWIDFGGSETFFFGGGSYTSEKQLDSAFTIAGTTAMIVGAMIGARAGMALHAGRLDGAMRPDRQLLFRAWLYGILFYGLIGAILFALFDRRPGLEALAHRVLQLAGVVLSYQLFSRWLARRRVKPGTGSGA